MDREKEVRRRGKAEKRQQADRGSDAEKKKYRHQTNAIKKIRALPTLDLLHGYEPRRRRAYVDNTS